MEISVKNFKLLQPNDVLIETGKFEEEKTDSGIFLGNKKSVLKRNTEGYVVEIGPEVRSVKIGDYVYFTVAHGVEMPFEEGLYTYILEKNIIGKKINLD